MSSLSSKATSSRNDPRGKQRRRRIYRSLHDCIINKGYVKTTLAEIAQAAGMSPSHLLYYFKGKEDILAQYFALVSVRFLERIAEFSKEAAEDQVTLLADFWFKGETSTKTEIGFMLECFGAAVNDHQLKTTKAEFDSKCKAYLVKIFEAAPESWTSTPKDSAEIVYAMMIGLRSAVYFDDNIDLDYVHQLFQVTVNNMCGFTR